MNKTGRARSTRIGILVLLTIVAFTGAGCTDVTEVNKRVLVSAIGFDVSDNEGELKLSVQVPSLAAGGGGQSGGLLGGGGGGSGQASAATYTITAETLSEALREARFQVPGQLFLGSIRMILFSEDFAQSNILSVLDLLSQDPFLPLHTPILITRGSSAAFLNSRSRIATTPIIHINKLIDGARRPSGVVTPLALYQLFDNSISGIGAVWTPVTDSLENGPAVVGLGIFQKGLLRQTASGNDAALLVSINRSKSVFVELTIPSEDRQVGLHFRNLRITGSLDREMKTAHIRMIGSAYVIERSGAPIRNYPGSTFENEINAALAGELRRLLTDLYAKGIDALNLTEQVRRRSPNGNVPSRWEDHLPSISFAIDPKVGILHAQRGS